jgi:hypothetical protein
MANPEHAQQHDGETQHAIHLPPPSIWPAVLALGIALLLTGLILNIVVVIVGAILVVGSIALWVRDARREFNELPD